MTFAFLGTVIVVFGLVLLLERTPGDGALLSRPAGLWRWLTSGNWAAKIGGALLSIGTGALLRYLLLNVAWPASDKIMAGVVLAATLGAASGAIAPRPARRAISLALAGAALAVAYLTAYAAYGFFQFVKDLQALGLLFIVASVATVVAITRRSVSLAVLAMLGAYLAPAFALEAPGPVEVNGYYLAASLVTLVMVWSRGWRPLIHLSFLFTLAGAVFFCWTRGFYEPQHYAQMEPLLLGLVAVHLAMPIMEVAPRPWADDQRGEGSWRHRFDEWYFVALPLVAAALTLLLAPTLRREGAFGLLGLALLWGLAACAERVRAGRGGFRYLCVGSMFLVAAGLLAVIDIPVFLIAAVLLCAVIVAAERLELHGAAELLVVVLALLSAAAYSLQSILQPEIGLPFVNGPFVEQLLLGIALLTAGRACVRRNRTAAPIFLSYGAAWLLIVIAREIGRLDSEYLAEISYGGVLLATVAMSVVAQVRRRPPNLLLMVLLGVALLASGVASAPRLAVAWLLPLMLAGQVLYSVLALQCDRMALEDEAAHDLVGAIARSLLPLLLVPWALIFASHLSNPRIDVLWTFVVGSALGASLQARWLVRATGRQPNWLSPVGFFLFGALLFHETLLHIDRNAWDVAFEVIAVAYLAETARFLSVAKTQNARWFGYAAITAVACVTAAMALRLFGPAGTLTIAALDDMLLPAMVSLLWAAIGALLTWSATRKHSRTLWSLGALLLIAAAVKLILFDFGSLGELGNILATIGAGGVFLLVAWLAPFPPKSISGPAEHAGSHPTSL
jgi:uncharacterized membrane protein